MEKQNSPPELVDKIETIKREINQSHIEYIRSSPVDRKLEGMIQSGTEILMSTQAKRVRAVIPVLIAEALNDDTDAAKKYGVLIELLHFSSLVHDDVIDGDRNRRQKPSLNALYGDYNAILLGEYRKMAEMKTGSLFSLSFGFPFVGTDEVRFAIDTGRLFGLLFQIYDDYLDRDKEKANYNIYSLMSPDEVSGKCRTLFADLSSRCDRLAISAVLTHIVQYLQLYGYFFDIKP